MAATGMDLEEEEFHRSQERCGFAFLFLILSLVCLFFCLSFFLPFFLKLGGVRWDERRRDYGEGRQEDNAGCHRAGGQKK